MAIVLNLIISLVLLIVASILFTESIEKIGNAMKYAHSFTGTIISPLFTSLPELIVIIISIVVVGDGKGSEIVAGTIIGEPFMVSSLGFFLLALSFFFGRNSLRNTKIDTIFPRIFVIFSLIFPIMLIPAFFHGLAVKLITVILLISIYILILNYFQKNRTNEEGSDSKNERKIILMFKLLVGFAIMLIGSYFLIKTIDSITVTYRIGAELISIIVIPIGTILPETFNAMIWSYKGKMNLAVGSLIGEELLFGTFYPIIGILITKWVIDISGLIAIALTSLFSIITGSLMWKTKFWIWALLMSFIVLVLYVLAVFY